MQLTLVVKLCSVALIIALTASADPFDLTQPPREEWPTYGGSFSNQRFSQLAQITRDNVRHLRVKWTFPIPDAGQSTTSLETTPLVIKGSEAGQPARDAVMFVTSPLNRVLALDAASGEQLWEAATPLRHPLRLCCSSSNRGITFGRVEVVSNGLAPRVYMATLDARLWVVDAATGQPSASFADGIGPLGSVTVADNNAGFSLTMAPLFIPRIHIPTRGLASGRDVVIVGISGAEFETRAFVTAYDVGTGDLVSAGAQRWQNHTSVPLVGGRWRPLGGSSSMVKARAQRVP